MREFGARNTEIANALKNGLSKSTIRRYDRVPDVPSRASSILPGPLQPSLTATSKLESMLLYSPDSVNFFRKCLDTKSGKLLYRVAKFKILCITNNAYIMNTISEN